MGILSKTIDTVKDVGKGVLTTLLDPTGNTRGSIAAQKLVDEGQGYINKLEDQIGASTLFWKDHQQMLGDLYSSAEWKEAALAKEIEQEKAKLKDTSETFNATEYRQKLIDSGQADELYRVYEEKMNKAEDYKLTSGVDYTDTNIKAHIKNHSRTSRNVINRAARQLFNAYGWDKDLFAAFGFGRDRTTITQEIGDYSFLLQAEDGPIKQRFIAQLTEELNAGEGRFNNIDAGQLATMFESMNVDYDPVLKNASKRSMGKYGTNSETAKVVNQYAKGEYSETFSALKDANSGIEYTKIIDKLDASSAEKFQEDLNTVSAYVLNIYNDVGLVKYGGTLNPKDAVEKAMLILLGSEEGPMGQKLKARTTWAGLGVATEYSEMTDREKKELFDALPTILNLMAGIEQATPEQERKMMEQIELVRNEARQITLAEDLNHPVNVASRVVGGAGNEGEADYVAPISFTSIEQRDAYILKDKLEFEEKDYAKEDIQRYVDTVSTADIKESTTEDLFGPSEELPEDYPTVEKAMASQPKVDFAKGAEERYSILQSPEKDSAIAVRKLFDSIADKLSGTVDTSRLEYGNVDIKNYVDDSLTPKQLESFKGASEEKIDNAVKKAVESMKADKEEEGDTLTEGFLKADFSNVPNFSMKNPKHKAAFNAGEIVFLLPSLIGNDILTANQYLNASEDVKKAGRFLKRKAKSLLSNAKDVFENVRDPYMIMEETTLEFKKENKIENTIDIIDKLKNELRYLEGDSKNKGKPVLKAYKLEGEEYYTIGFGHYGSDVTKDMEITVERAEELLEEDILKRIPKIQEDFKDFEKFKNYLKIPMFIEYYRGSLTGSGSPKTTRLINEGKYEEAAIEFLDNEEYINAKKLNRMGIRKRMESVVKALKYYSRNK